MLTDKGLQSSAGRGVALTMITALILTTSEVPLVAAPTAPDSSGISTTVASSRATDFSAARRRRHYHRGASAAGAAFMGLAIGMAAGAIAAQQRREYYEHYGYYYGRKSGCLVYDETGAGVARLWEVCCDRRDLAPRLVLI